MGVLNFQIAKLEKQKEAIIKKLGNLQAKRSKLTAEIDSKIKEQQDLLLELNKQINQIKNN